MTGYVPNHEIIATLGELNSSIKTPLWLFGGVAVDFLVGRWTRPHCDIDLNTFSEYRTDLARELEAIGYRCEGPAVSWLTHWRQGHTGRSLEIVFLERGNDDSAFLVIPAGAAVGVPGRYPTSTGYMQPSRFASLDGVSFRVCSATGEWLARQRGLTLVPGRQIEPKIRHDLALLETLIPAAELSALHASTEVKTA